MQSFHTILLGIQYALFGLYVLMLLPNITLPLASLQIQREGREGAGVSLIPFYLFVPPMAVIALLFDGESFLFHFVELLLVLIALIFLTIVLMYIAVDPKNWTMC